MPTYEYLCKTCKYNFDTIQRITEDALEECPRCKKNTLTKVISSVKFQLTGTGWPSKDIKRK